MSQLIDINTVEKLQLQQFFYTLVDRQLLGELNYVSFDVCRTMNTLEQLHASGRLQGCALTVDNNIIGVYICTLGNKWFDHGTITMNEMLLFILPEFRGDSIFGEMQEYIEYICRKLKVTTLQVGNEITPQSVKYKKLLERYGFETYEVYRKRIK